MKDHVKIEGFSSLYEHSIENKLDMISEAVRRICPTFHVCTTTLDKVFITDEDTGEVMRYDYVIGEGKKITFSNHVFVKIENSSQNFQEKRKSVSEGIVDAIWSEDETKIQESSDSLINTVKDELELSRRPSLTTGLTVRDVVESVLKDAPENICLAIAKATSRFGISKHHDDIVVNMSENRLPLDRIKTSIQLVNIVRGRENAKQLSENSNFVNLIQEIAQTDKTDKNYKALVKKLTENFGGELFCLSPAERMELFKKASTKSEEVLGVYESFTSFLKSSSPNLVQNLESAITENGRYPFAVALQTLSESIDLDLLESINITALRDTMKTILKDGSDTRLLSQRQQEEFSAVIGALDAMLEGKNSDYGIVQVAVNEIATIAPTTYYPASDIDNEYPLGMYAGSTSDFSFLGKDMGDAMTQTHDPLSKEDAETLSKAWWMNVGPNGEKIGVTERYADRLTYGLSEFNLVRKSDTNLIGNYKGYAVHVECNGIPSLKLKKQNQEVASIEVDPDKEQYVSSGKTNNDREMAEGIMTIMVPGWAHEAFGSQLVQKAQNLAKKLSKGLEDDPQADQTLDDAGEKEEEKGSKTEQEKASMPNDPDLVKEDNLNETYSHYWTLERKFTDAEWNEVIKWVKKTLDRARRDGISIKGPLGEGEPEISADKIAFNGDVMKDQDYETFIIRKNVANRFQFCKTDRQPYDKIILTILWGIKKIAPDIFTRLESDGGDKVFKNYLGTDSPKRP